MLFAVEPCAWACVCVCCVCCGVCGESLVVCMYNFSVTINGEGKVFREIDLTRSDLIWSWLDGVGMRGDAPRIEKEMKGLLFWEESLQWPREKGQRKKKICKPNLFHFINVCVLFFHYGMNEWNEKRRRIWSPKEAGRWTFQKWVHGERVG